MKLTNKDKNYLISIGYHTEDLNEIEKATKTMFYEMFSNTDKNIPDVRVNQKQAITLLGKESFLSGVARATFHRTAVRVCTSTPNISVYFERKNNFIF